MHRFLRIGTTQKRIFQFALATGTVAAVTECPPNKSLYKSSSYNMSPMVAHCLSFSTSLPSKLKKCDQKQLEPGSHSRTELFEELEQLSHENKTVSVLWRLCRACFDISEEIPAKGTQEERNEKERLVRKALDLAQEAVTEANKGEAGSDSRDCSAAHKWFGICLSSLGDYLGTKEKIKNSFTIQESFKKASELNPSDPNCFHLLGRWAFSVASISWVERQAASFIFATPPTSDYSKALKLFEKAEEMQPGFWKTNMLMLAKCKYQLGDRQSAKQWAEAALKLPIRTPEDRDSQEQVKELLSKL